MSEFEFVFTLYSLLLSFSLVALITGLGRSLVAVVKLDDFRVGYLLPLLGAFVLLDLLSFWIAAWVVRDEIAVNSETLLAVTIFAAGYFLAANLVFPERPEEEDDLSDHYFRVRRLVLGILLVLLGCQWFYYWNLPALSGVVTQTSVWGWTIVLVILMVAAMLVRSRLANAAILAALVARYAYVYLA